MSRRDDSDADMPSIPGSPEAGVPRLPDGNLDALLTDDLLTDEEFAGLQPATRLLAMLNAEPEDDELAGHARAMAEFRHRGGVPARSRLTGNRKPRLITSLLTAKAAAAAVAVAALGGAAAAAYTGALPAPAQQLAHKAIGAPSPKPNHGPATTQATPTHPAAASPDAASPAAASPAATTPDATSPVAFGLCTAYAHANAHGTASQKAVAFRNLAAAAGGAAKIAAFCAVVPHPGSTQAPAPSHPSGKPTSHSTGKPSSLPASHATGKPSAAPTHPSGKPSSARASH
jgi:hypothetical protein